MTDICELDDLHLNIKPHEDLPKENFPHNLHQANIQSNSKVENYTLDKKPLSKIPFGAANTFQSNIQPHPNPIKTKISSNDRFIPQRKPINTAWAQQSIIDESNTKKRSSADKKKSKNLFKDLTGYDKCRVLNFRSEFSSNKKPGFDTLNQTDPFIFGKRTYGYTANSVKRRILPKRAEKVLDAPGLINDYYQNLIDWGANNLQAVCLNESVFLWNPISQQGVPFLNTQDPQKNPTSICWSQKNEHLLAIGFSDTQVKIRDFIHEANVKTYEDHWARVSAIHWHPTNPHLMSTGSKDCEIISYDLRKPRPISHCRGHSQEVCGLKWSPDGSFLASGGNDNKLLIWDPRRLSTPLCHFNEHTAAVKALGWCPWQKNLVCSGGGSIDKTVKFWNVNEGRLLDSYDTDSQVCSLIFNPRSKELVTAHGYSQNQQSQWKYPSMQKIGDMYGHRDRVLHLSLSPDNTTVVSAGADETLRFWKVLDNKDDDKMVSTKSLLVPLNIRQVVMGCRFRGSCINQFQLMIQYQNKAELQLIGLVGLVPFDLPQQSPMPDVD